MPSEVEKDAITGTETTGHEWDGIKELNTPLPKWWLYVMYATIIWSLGYFVFYPAIPWVNGFTRGILDYDQRTDLDRQLAEVREFRGELLTRIEGASLAEIREDDELLDFAVRGGGRAAFAENCAPCHGLGGGGQQGGYPALADDAWIWGGTLDDIYATLLYGIRSDHPQTRFGIMPAYGVDEILTREEITDIAHYVVSLSGETEDAEAAARGAELYQRPDLCVTCHGENAEGNVFLGAPALSDQIWLYGGTVAEITAQVHNPQYGVMPAWIDRLDDATIKMVSVYVHALGGGQ